MLRSDPHRIRTTAIIGVGILACALAVGTPGFAIGRTRSHGLTAALGFASKNEVDMVIPSVGWRFELEPGDRIGACGEAIGTDLSFVVEPLIGAIVGDKDSVEAQIVPMVRLEPLALQDAVVLPFLEAGIGVIYTGLEGLDLGSNFLFSDNVGVGVSLALPDEWTWSRASIGYRYRHISHAGIFGSPNSGMNTHYLTLTFE